MFKAQTETNGGDIGLEGVYISLVIAVRHVNLSTVKVEINEHSKYSRFTRLCRRTAFSEHFASVETPSAFSYLY